MLYRRGHVGLVMHILLCTTFLQFPLVVEAQEYPLATVKEIVSIGGVDAPSEAAWSVPPVVSIGPDGLAYVREPMVVRAFNSSGRMVRTYGSPGQGPAEFMRASAHGFLGDTLWIVDLRQAKVALFSLDGQLLETRRLERPDREHFLLPDGALLYRPRDVRAGNERTRAPVVISGQSRDQEDTLFVSEVNDGLFIPNLGTFSYRPLPRYPLFDLSSDGRLFAVVSWSDGDSEVSITVYDAPAATIRAQTRVPLRPKRISNRVARSFVERGLEMAGRAAARTRMLGYPVPSDLRAAVEEGLRIPEFIPPVQEVDVGSDGSVWLHLSDIGWGGELLVLPGSGGSPFRVSVAEGIRVEDVSDRTLWISERGEFDAPIIRQLAVESPSRSDTGIGPAMP